MFDKLGGLPAHPLLVHVPVVLVPLAAIGALVIVCRPQLMRSYGWLVLAISGLGFVGAVFAAQSGESLLESFQQAGQTISPTLQDHADLGDTVQGISGIFFLIVLAWVLFAWWRRRAGEEKVTATVRKPKLVGIVLAVLVVLGGIGATVSVTLAGHNGAKAVWQAKK